MLYTALQEEERMKSVLQYIQKEKGDWKKMTTHEKKELYRAAFCQTFAEAYAPTGEWKAILGLTLICISTGLWGFIWLTTYGK